MELKTKVHAADGRQELFVTREFDLPLELLFKAYSDPELVEQWMGTKVLALDCRKHGSWRFETTNGEGNVVFQANGTIHEFLENKKIVRTFEMVGAPFDVQLEFIEFEKIGDNTSRLNIQTVFRSVALRDEMLKLPFARGLSMAHDRLQAILGKLQ